MRWAVVVAVILGAVLAGLGVAALTGGRIGAGASPEPTRMVAVASPTPPVSPSAEPSPSPTAEPTAEPTIPASPKASAPATPVAEDDPEVGLLVFRIAPWSDIISPYTLSLMQDGRLVRISVGGGPQALQQRRLTPEAVEYVRSEIAGTGLFDESAFLGPVALPGKELPGRGTVGYRVDFATDDGVVEVGWVSIASDEVHWAEPSPERERLDLLGRWLAELELWLPADFWAEPEPTAYVPAR